MTMTADQIRTAIQTYYPSLWALINKPGVYDVLAQAVDQNWPGTRVQAALEQTPYFQSTPVQVRQWDALTATDPATARRQTDMVGGIIDQLQAQLGTQVPDRQALLNEALAYGLNSDQIRGQILRYTSPGAVQNTGLIKTTQDQLRSIGADYGIAMSGDTTFKYALGIANGTMDQNTFADYAKQQAKVLYPYLTDVLDAGITVAQYADPYKQTAMRELGIGSADFNLLDPKWSRVLHPDPGNANRSMSQLDWVNVLRTDPRYGYDRSENGRTEASQFATQIGQMFGKVA